MKPALRISAPPEPTAPALDAPNSISLPANRAAHRVFVALVVAIDLAVAAAGIAVVTPLRYEWSQVAESLRAGRQSTSKAFGSRLQSVCMRRHSIVSLSWSRVRLCSNYICHSGLCVLRNI